MASCTEMEELLPMYLDDVLEDDERLMLEEHLKSCPNCQEELAKYRQLDNQLKQWSELEVEPPSTFHRELMSRLQEVQQNEDLVQENEKGKILSFVQRKEVKRWIPYTAAAAIILCLLPMLFQQQSNHIATKIEQEPLRTQPVEPKLAKEDIEQEGSTQQPIENGKKQSSINGESQDVKQYSGQGEGESTQASPLEQPVPAEETDKDKQPDVVLGARGPNESPINDTEGSVNPEGETGLLRQPLSEGPMPVPYTVSEENQDAEVAKLMERLKQLNDKRDGLVAQQEKRPTDQRAKTLAKVEEEIAAVQQQLDQLSSQEIIPGSDEGSQEKN